MQLKLSKKGYKNFKIRQLSLICESKFVAFKMFDDANNPKSDSYFEFLKFFS